MAGVGGAVALVVAYRRQNDLEQGRFVERFGAAAAQLGSPDPAVRIAGVYAMAGVADESTTFSVASNASTFSVAIYACPTIRITAAATPTPN